MSPLAAFVLVLARVGVLVACCPPLCPEPIRGALKAGLIFWLALALTLASLPGSLALAAPQGALGMALAMAGEAAIGLGLALLLRLGASAIGLTGELVEMVAGFGFSQIVDPMTQEQGGPIRMLAQLLGGMVFFAVGGQRRVVEALALGFRALPPGQAPWRPELGLALNHQLGQMLAVALRMAAPMLAAALATLLCLAFLTRVAPQLNIWSIGFLITTSVSLVGLIWIIPAWTHQMTLVWQDRLGALAPWLGR